MTKFFAAANTENGFESLFPIYFSPDTHRRLYILKGGPGTGKSTLIRQIGFVAKASGYETEYIYCSSDTDSLDGVRIPSLGISVLDGTAPHTVEARYPGAVEQIVDLGEAFDKRSLEKEREAIASLCHAKSDAYRTAYRFLAAAGRLAHETDDLLRSAFLSGKADAVSERLLLTLKKAKKGEETPTYLSAIGTHGYVKLDTLHKKAKKIYAITEKNGLEYLFMKRLHTALLREGLSMTVAKTPLTREHIETLYINGADVLFTITSETEAQGADKIINSARFASREGLSAVRQKLRFAEKCEKALMEGALSALAEAGRLHGELEAIYGKYTDFSVIDRIRHRMISEIFANNM